MANLPGYLPLLLGLTLVVATLYSSVGHGGASGYLAAMALIGMAPAQMKPTALVLNLLVAGLGTARYLKEGCFSWKVFWPFALGSVPFAFLGGATTAPDLLYKRLLGLALFVAAAGLVWRGKSDRPKAAVPILLGVLIGVVIGFMSGLIGVGGGIFLSPILILLGWATTRETLGIAALFIFVNSAAGLAGQAGTLHNIPIEAWYLAPTALIGGLIGTQLGAKKLGVVGIRLALTIVLCVAAGKLVLPEKKKVALRGVPVQELVSGTNTSGVRRQVERSAAFPA